MGSHAIINMPIRLAILETDTPVPGIKAKYQSYGGVFTHMFKRACAALPHPVPLESQLTLSFHDVVNDLTAYPDPETIDAILITGSKYNAFDSDEWILRLVQFTKRCLDGGRIRVIGVCYGHQIIGRALGAELGRSTSGWEVSVVEHELTEEGKKVLGIEKMVNITLSSTNRKNARLNFTVTDTTLVLVNPPNAPRCRALISPGCSPASSDKRLRQPGYVHTRPDDFGPGAP